MYLLLFSIALSFWIALRLADHIISREFIMYGLEEGNPLMRDRYGFLRTGFSAFIGDIIIGCAFLAIYLFLNKQWAWAAPAAGSIVSGLIILKNHKAMANQRKKQIAALQMLAAIPEGGELPSWLTLTSRIDRHWLALFPWIYENAVGSLRDPAEQNRAYSILIHRVHQLARGNPDQWFKSNL